MKEQNKPKESERRQATVMFIDIAGFTEMSEKLYAEEVTNITNACFEMMGEIIEHNGGTIDKFIGDSVMALFGVPTAIENSCNKALNTAIEIRNSLYDFNQSRNLKIPLDIHIGINTGKVIAGLVGSSKRKDYTVMGDTVNTAARFEDISTSGQILVGDLTYHEASPEFEFKTRLPITLKGKEKPVPVYELLSTKSIVSKPQIDTDRSIYSEMVGRDEVFNTLKSHLHKVIKGRGAIVNVIGEPGIGKSRLIVELQKSEDTQKVAFLKGAASSIGKDLSYHPIIEILQKWALIKEEDSTEEALEKLEEVISTVDSEGATEILPFIATLMGLKLEGKYAERVKGIEGAALEKLILKNLKDLMTKATDIRPIVFVVEDVHWADLTSIELLESLFRLADKHPILFINVFRPDYEETSERLLETVKNKYSDNHSEIYLERLDVKHVELLVNNLLKSVSLPVEIKTSISNRAEGNPLFVEEVLSSFIDEGVVRLENGQFQVTDKIHSVVIPGSIQEVLMARLDRLDDENKSLLKKASVIGRYFFQKILSEITEHSEEMNDQLAFLQEVQLIRERMRLKDIEYFFKHVLLQEVTYGSILVQQRKALHLEVATAIETVFTHRLNEFYGVLSWHYGRGENIEKEEEYLIKAGEEAVKAGASNEAINYYREALDLYIVKMGQEANPEKIAMLERNIAFAFYNKGHMAEAIEYFDKALEGLGVKITRNKIIQILKFSYNLLIVIKNLYWPSKKAKKSPSNKDVMFFELWEKRCLSFVNTDSKRAFIDNTVLFRKLDKFDLRKMKRGSHFYFFGISVFSAAGFSISISEKFLEHSQKIITQNDIESLFVLKAYENVHNYVAGHWNRGYKIDDELLNAGLRLGDLFKVYIFTSYPFYIAAGRGEFGYAELLLNRMHEIADTYDYDAGRFYESLYQISYHLNRRRFYDISRFVDKSMAMVNKLGFRDFKLRLLGMSAKAQILLRDFTGAEESLSEINQILHEAGRVIALHSRDYFLSQFLFDVHQFENYSVSTSGVAKSKINKFKRKAHKSGKDAIKISHKIAEKKPEALRLMGILYWLENKQEKALNYWENSIKEAEHLTARPELARTHMEVGKRLLESKSKYQELNGISAEEYLDKAEVLFKEMELAWDLEELEKVRLANTAFHDKKQDT